jgi:hypothetical protein
MRRPVPIQQRIAELAEQHNLGSRNSEVRNLALALYAHHDRLDAFLQIAGAEQPPIAQIRNCLSARYAPGFGGAIVVFGLCFIAGSEDRAAARSQVEA